MGIRAGCGLALTLAWLIAGCSDDGAGDGSASDTETDDAVMDTAAGPGSDGGTSDEDEPTPQEMPEAAGGAGTTPAPAPQVDAAAPFFEPDRVLEVRIELAEDDWEAIRAQGRSLLEIFGGDDCLADPFGSPFTFVRGSVSVDGETIDDVGVRKKGFFGSLSYDKPSLKLDFGEYVDGQTLSGMRRMTLNNNKQDQGHLNQCLGYQFFSDAGVPAPRCNFARVFVNGEYLGVYSHIESVKKPFLREHFDSDGGNLYEGTLSDFRAGWDGTFEQKTNASSDPGKADIGALTAALSSGGDALDAIDPLLDVERFIRFWAVESLVGHGDGYSSNNNNFFVYADPADGRFVFMPWGIDQLFDNGEERAGRPLPVVRTQGVVAHRIYDSEQGRARYIARMETLLDDYRLDDRLAEIDRMEALIAPHIPSAARADFETGVANLRVFIEAREGQVRDQLAAGLPRTADGLRERICFEPQGTVAATFSTTWNSLDNPAVNPASFSATFTPTGTSFTNTPNPLGLTTALAGIDENAESPEFEATILLIVQQLDGTSLLALVQTDLPGLSPGETPLDFTTTRGLIVRQRDGEDGMLVGILGEGTLTLDQASTTDGAPVSGSYTATVFDPGFLGR